MRAGDFSPFVASCTRRFVTAIVARTHATGTVVTRVEPGKEPRVAANLFVDGTGVAYEDYLANADVEGVVVLRDNQLQTDAVIRDVGRRLGGDVPRGEAERLGDQRLGGHDAGRVILRRRRGGDDSGVLVHGHPQVAFRSQRLVREGERRGDDQLALRRVLVGERGRRGDGPRRRVGHGRRAAPAAYVDEARAKAPLSATRWRGSRATRVVLSACFLRGETAC